MTARGIVARINILTAAFRAAGAPVIFCTIAARTPDWDGFLVNCALAARIKRTGKLVVGTAGGALHDDLVVEPSDVVSHRSHGMAPFTGTTLDATLRGYGIDTVVLSGVSTNIALPGAATEAVALGYSVVLAEDCTAGATPETHQLQITEHLPLLATITDAESVDRLTARRPEPTSPSPTNPRSGNSHNDTFSDTIHGSESREGA